MKQTILLFLHLCLFSFFSFQLFSQCTPNEMYRDSAVGVYPPPFSDTNPDGGITESACINAPYEFVFTFKIPDTISISGFTVNLDSITIEESGAVGGMPVGLEYGCNPGDCVFTPMDTLACLVVFGTATDANTPGDYPLTISTMIFTNLGAFAVEFPTTIIPNADGEYILTLEEEGSGNCLVGTEDYITKNLRVSNSPNPFGSVTNIEVYSQVRERLDFKVYDMLGNLVHQRIVEISEGANNFEFDGTSLANGIYTFSLSNQLGAITRKIVISR